MDVYIYSINSMTVGSVQTTNNSLTIVEYRKWRGNLCLKICLQKEVTRIKPILSTLETC